VPGQDELQRRMDELGEGIDPRGREIEPRWGRETERFYRERGFATRVGYGDNPAVLLIDMTRALCDPGFSTSGCLRAAAVDGVSHGLRGLPADSRRRRLEPAARSR